MKRELQFSLRVNASSDFDISLHALIAECVQELSLAENCHKGAGAERHIVQFEGTAEVFVEYATFSQVLEDDDQ